ncbi:hypothetical protein AVEN_270362-1 [Araneus ventricosus]|uniref:Uncharacterized protein n=1 Tax=Araneus ventricosus TaxID=182803 RepID=A0A4Y2MKS3_ARAVE|nr:hypothetical protein AVEN_270362-1 [Araneus ventricosus]
MLSTIVRSLRKKAINCPLLEIHTITPQSIQNEHLPQHRDTHTKNEIFSYPVLCANGNGGMCLTVQLVKLVQCCKTIEENSVLQYSLQEVAAGG